MKSVTSPEEESAVIQPCPLDAMGSEVKNLPTATSLGEEFRFATLGDWLLVSSLLLNTNFILALNHSPWETFGDLLKTVVQLIGLKRVHLSHCGYLVRENCFHTTQHYFKYLRKVKEFSKLLYFS